MQCTTSRSSVLCCSSQDYCPPTHRVTIPQVCVSQSKRHMQQQQQQQQQQQHATIIKVVWWVTQHESYETRGRSHVCLPLEYSFRNALHANMPANCSALLELLSCLGMLDNLQPDKSLCNQSRCFAPMDTQMERKQRKEEANTHTHICTHREIERERPYESQ